MNLLTKTELQDHQVPAVNKLLSIKVGALFMDMGTGKTRTAIEFIVKRLHKIDKTVWLCPASLMATAYQQFEEHSYLNCFVFKSDTVIENLPKADVYIVSLESMGSSDRCKLTVFDMITDKSFIIIDESSFIKNHKAKRTNFLMNFNHKSKYRMILSGTPMSQGVVDLYSQMSFLSTKILGYKSFWRFSKVHLKYSDKYPGMIEREYKVDDIAKKIAPYVYQVTKDECLSLPGKMYEKLFCDLTYEQREYYEEAKSFYLDTDIEDFSSYTIFCLFNELQQIVSGYSKRLNKEFKTNKTEILEYSLDKLKDEKVIIWCKYLFDIKTIKRILDRKKLTYTVISGVQSIKEKSENQAKFKNGTQYLIATQDAGGYGLNLQFSNHAIYYTNNFKYQSRIQSEDRQDRIGQTKKVLYLDLITRNSIDTRIKAALEMKGNAVQAFKDEIDSIKDKKILNQLINKL